MSHPLENASFNVQLPTGRQMQVVGLGLNAVDWICVVPSFPRHDSKLQIAEMRRLGGGEVATACTVCGRFGLATRYIGKVGDDEVGHFTLADLGKEPLKLEIEVVAGCRSQIAVIIVDRPTGERTVLWDRDSGLVFRPEQVSRASITDACLLHLDGNDTAAAIQAARMARDAGMAVTLDIDKVQPGVEELLKYTDFAIPSMDFIRQFFQTEDWRQGLRRLRNHTNAFLAVTRGRMGVAVLWEDEIFEVPGFVVGTADTTGAGDVFHGAFAYTLFQGWNVWKSLEFCNAAAALACTKLGARAGIPTLQEADRLIATGKRRPLKENS